MKLDLLYEVDVPKPWGEAPSLRPAGGRAARLRARPWSRSASPTSSASTPSWRVEHHFREGRSHCPAPEVLIGALSPDHRADLRLGFGVTLMPLGFTPPARGREGRHRRHPLRRPGRVGHRPLDPDGADRVRRRPREEPRSGPRGDPRSWSRCGRTSTSSTTASASTSRGGWSRRSRSRTRIRRRGWRRPATAAPRSPASTGSASCRSPSCSRSSGWPQQIEALPRRPRRTRSRSPGSRTTGSRRTRWSTAPRRSSRPRPTASGTRCGGGTRTSPSSPWSGSSRTCRRRSRTRSSRCSRSSRRATSTRKTFNDADMIIVGDPDQCMEKILQYEELGVDQLICYVQFGHLQHEAIMRTIELARQAHHPRARAARRKTTTRSGRDRRRPMSHRLIDDQRRRQRRPRLPGPAPARRPRVRGGRGGPGDRPPDRPRPGVGGARVFCIDTRKRAAPEKSPRRSAASRGSGDATNASDVERLSPRPRRELGRIDGLVDIVGMARYADARSSIDRRGLGLALRHRPAPRVPLLAARRAGHGRDRRGRHGVRRVGDGHHRRRRGTRRTARPRPG